MDYLQQLQARWDDLRGRPNTKEEIEEVLKLGKLIEIERAKEFGELFLELGELGLHADSIWDLVNMKGRYPDGVVDLLLRYLPFDYYDRNKEGIIRALTVKEARGKACLSLISEYEKTPKEKSNLRWVIGNAIATTMTLKEVDWVYSTVVDKTNGSSRGMLVLALGTVKTEKSENILIDLLDDDEVAPQALAALGKLKSRKAKNKIIQMRESKNSLIRLEATKALRRIDKF
ncbi:HEAT repeat domain-containing protein [Pedobacter sp. WC2501]|uniref:HEAT repeat domain-containing protein n=1 Tax=Pedobacter sp. WC2501 TaxID=3461400 RepID=UPI0040452383